MYVHKACVYEHVTWGATGEGRRSSNPHEPPMNLSYIAGRQADRHILTYFIYIYVQWWPSRFNRDGNLKNKASDVNRECTDLWTRPCKLTSIRIYDVGYNEV